VGFNGNYVFNPNVVTANWSDPYAGNIAANTTIGGAGQGTVDILQSLTVVSNAVLTIAPGTTVRFASGTGLSVQQGALVANGTALDPIVFTSADDRSGLSAAPGNWNGITLGSGAGASVLRHVFVKYGTGLSVSNCAPTVDAFTALLNAPAGLTLTGTASLSTTNALLAFNGVGAQQLGSAQLTIVNSVLKNNDTNALAYGGLSLRANQNWWGSATVADIDATLKGAVDRTGFLAGEPLLTPAIGAVSNLTQVGSQSVNLRLACRTADSLRLSEDSTFSAVFFAPFTNQTVFGLSGGGGQKTVFAQFRSLTGQTSAPVALTITYITTGPAIAGFNLSEGMVLARPLQVTGSASAPLGMAAMELSIDGFGQATNAGGNFSCWLDVRNFNSGVHRVKLLARDTSGNIASRELNLVMAPTPPPAPALTAPATDLVVNSNSVSVAGTAEPLIEVRLFRSGTLAGTTNATVNGTFNFANVPLLEGANQLTALAIDALGSAGSLIRNVTLDTMPPAQLVMDAPMYRPGSGLGLSWRFPSTGKRATTFQVFWSTAPITNINQASGSSLLLNGTSTSVQGLATTNYYFYVVGYDGLGNSSPLSGPVQFAYDAVPPTFSVAFNKPSPIGVGPLHVVLSASEPLKTMPTMTVQPYGNAPALLTLSNTALNTYEADINVTTFLPSGPVQLNVSAADLAGNPFNGPPAGPAL
ncbi:MAG TPA: Ig-like domain-containing protein, partial [Candidatus Sulfotelmatobacter sp.]|nr:Ig-like domain-containing protein [Candidatus Sulfotelmatobacter sp.]